MMQRSTDELVQQLARDLRPVKPIARLRVAVAVVVAVWLVAFVATGALTGSWPRFGDADFWSNPIGVAVLLGFVVAASSAVVSALASAVPGREALARRGQIGAGAAVVWLIVCGFGGVAVGAGSETALSLFAGSASCLGHSLALAIPAALAVGFYLSRGAPQYPLIASGIAAAGVASLGAVIVHATCDLPGGLHLLVGHCTTPIVAALLFALPLAGIVRRWSPVALES